jgi:hypothetical protein
MRNSGITGFDDAAGGGGFGGYGSRAVDGSGGSRWTGDHVRAGRPGTDAGQQLK